MLKSNWKNFHLLLKIGLIIFLLGVGPFLVVLGLTELELIESGNLALGTGPLVFITLWHSIILIVIGVILTFLKQKNKLSLNGPSKAHIILMIQQ